ncbi:MAG: RHS repeat protein, partial [Planctomycetes bacterium]|nr:RHS repeat protein [Planctomycetota bacterium]
MGSHSRGILSVILSVALGVTPVHGSADLLADGEAGTDRPRPAGTDLGRFLHVDLWTGALECVQGDLPGFERTWRSDLPAHLSGDLGTGWRHLYEIDLVRDEAGDPCLVDGGGRVVSFPGASATAGAEAAHGPADRLEPRDGGWRLRRVDGSLVDLDATGRAERIVSAEGLEQRLSYGADGALEAVLEGEREVLRFRHGEGGGLAAVQSLGGAAEDGSPPMSPPVSGAYFLRDAAGRLAGVERFAAGEAGRGRVDYGYDEAGRLVRVRPAGCVEARVLYDGAGRVAALEGDGVLPRTYAWEETAEGLQVEVVDGAGATVRIRFLEGGRRVEMEDPSGALTEVLLDHRRMPTAVRGPAGRLGLRYDAAGRLVDVALPDGGTEGYAYDEAGRLAARVDRRGNRTVYERDEAGRTIKVRHPDGSVEGATWDAAGRLASHRSALGAVTHHAYDDRGLLRSVSVEGGTTTLYDHDAAGRLRSVATPLGEVVRLAYDGAGRLVRVSGPGGAETYEYDAAGEVVAATDGAGRRTALERDGLGRVVG